MEVRLGSDIRFARVLREAGFRATFGRVALLEALEKAGKPIRVEELAKKLGKQIDITNLYRALEALAKAGIVRRVDLRPEFVHYELAEGKHHHHLVCDSCGKVEDVHLQEPALERSALRATRSFALVRTHSLEFFGTCRGCVV